MNKDFLSTISAIKGSKSRPVKDALVALQSLRRQLKEAKDQAVMPQHQIVRVRQLATDAIKTDLIMNNKAERDRLSIMLETLHSNYEKEYLHNSASNQRAIEQASRRYAAMSPAELSQEADKALSGNYATDPQILDELCINFKYVNPENFEPFRRALVQSNYDKPWENTDVGKTIATHAKMLAENPKHILCAGEDGKPFFLSVDDLDNFLDVEEKESEAGE